MNLFGYDRSKRSHLQEKIKGAGGLPPRRKHQWARKCERFMFLGFYCSGESCCCGKPYCGATYESMQQDRDIDPELHRHSVNEAEQQLWSILDNEWWEEG